MKTTETMATLAAGAPNGIQLQMKKSSLIQARSSGDFAFWRLSQDPDLERLCASIVLRAIEYSIKEHLMNEDGSKRLKRIPGADDSNPIIRWLLDLMYAAKWSDYSWCPSNITELKKSDACFDAAIRDYAQTPEFIEKFGTVEAAREFFARLKTERIPKVYLVLGHAEFDVLYAETAIKRLKRMLKLKIENASSFKLVLKNYVVALSYLKRDGVTVDWVGREVALEALKDLLQFKQEGRYYDITILPASKEVEYDCFYAHNVPSEWVNDRKLRFSATQENGEIVVTVEQILE